MHFKFSFTWVTEEKLPRNRVLWSVGERAAFWFARGKGDLQKNLSCSLSTYLQKSLAWLWAVLWWENLKLFGTHWPCPMWMQHSNLHSLHLQFWYDLSAFEWIPGLCDSISRFSAPQQKVLPSTEGHGYLYTYTSDTWRESGWNLWVMA